MLGRIGLSVLLLLLLAGCSSNASDPIDTAAPTPIELEAIEPDNRVNLIPGNHTEHWNNDTKIMKDEISFKMENVGDEPLECSVQLVYANATVQNKTIKYLGFLNAGEKREDSFVFLMPWGDAKVNIAPICRS